MFQDKLQKKLTNTLSKTKNYSMVLAKPSKNLMNKYNPTKKSIKSSIVQIDEF